MSGLKVLENILQSLDEAKSSGVKTFREVISSPGASRVRNVLYAGTVMGVQEFGHQGDDSLIGEEVDVEVKDSFCGDTDKSVHLYKVMRVLHGVDTHAKPVVFKTSYSGEKHGIFGVHQSFDPICRDYDVGFTQGLKSSVKYSIVTPDVTIRFPVGGGVRGSPVGAGRSTDETAIINAPFSVTPNSELIDILELFNPGQTSQDCFYRTENAYKQAARVVEAVRNSSDFKELTESYVRLSSEIGERAQQEHTMGIR